jgi:hypothetical protein
MLIILALMIAREKGLIAVDQMKKYARALHDIPDRITEVLAQSSKVQVFYIQLSRQLIRVQYRCWSWHALTDTPLLSYTSAGASTFLLRLRVLSS